MSLSSMASAYAIPIEMGKKYHGAQCLSQNLSDAGLEVIGGSTKLVHLLKQVETVAETDTTALIMGETGTGKELIARAIHTLSQRRQNSFVSTNCASIPTGLLESDLFGHEKGAYTGALAREIGRFELANGGTIFLDEIGDIRLNCSQSCFACCRSGNLKGWAATARCASISVWSQRLTGIWAKWSKKEPFGKICSTV